MTHFTPNDLGIPEAHRFLFARARLRWPSLVPLLLPFVLLCYGSRCAEESIRCHARAQEYVDLRMEEVHWQLYANGVKAECS